MGGSREGDGGPDTPPPPPLKNHKNIGFPTKCDPDPLKITKLSSQHSMVSNYRRASETPFQWRFASGLIMAHLYSGIWILSPIINLKKNVVKVGPPLRKLSGSAHVVWPRSDCSGRGRHCLHLKNVSKCMQQTTWADNIFIYVSIGNWSHW